MADSICVLDKNIAKTILCADNHVQYGIYLETKDLSDDPKWNRNQYYIDFAGRIYKKNEDEEKEKIVHKDDKVHIVKKYSAEHILLDQSITVYGSCFFCYPIVIDDDMESDAIFSRVKHRFISCQWEFFFEQGILKNVKPIKLQTRDELREELQKKTEGVLDDDDRVAQKHFTQLKKEGEIKTYVG